MRDIACSGILVVGLALAIAPVRGQQTPSAARASVDVSTLGPQVGAGIPDFALEDQKGVSRSLHAVMGPKGAMIVFFRSADW